MRFCCSRRRSVWQALRIVCQLDRQFLKFRLRFRDEFGQIRRRAAGWPRPGWRRSRRCSVNTGKPTHSASLAVVCAL